MPLILANDVSLFCSSTMSPNLRYFSATVLTNHPIYTINSNFIKLSSQHKDFGVIFSSDLSWSAHYNAISTKTYQTLGLMPLDEHSRSTVLKQINSCT